MTVARISKQLAEQIKGTEYAENLVFNPVQDGNGNWIVSLVCAQEGLDAHQYQEIEFEPKEVEEL